MRQSRGKHLVCFIIAVLHFTEGHGSSRNDRARSLTKRETETSVNTELRAQVSSNPIPVPSVSDFIVSNNLPQEPVAIVSALKTQEGSASRTLDTNPLTDIRLDIPLEAEQQPRTLLVDPSVSLPLLPEVKTADTASLGLSSEVLAQKNEIYSLQNMSGAANEPVSSPPFLEPGVTLTDPIAPVPNEYMIQTSDVPPIPFQLPSPVAMVFGAQDEGISLNSPAQSEPNRLMSAGSVVPTVDITGPPTSINQSGVIIEPLIYVTQNTSNIGIIKPEISFLRGVNGGPEIVPKPEAESVIQTPILFGPGPGINYVLQEPVESVDPKVNLAATAVSLVGAVDVNAGLQPSALPEPVGTPSKEANTTPGIVPHAKPEPVFQADSPVVLPVQPAPSPQIDAIFVPSSSKTPPVLWTLTPSPTFVSSTNNPTTAFTPAPTLLPQNVSPLINIEKPTKINILKDSPIIIPSWKPIIFKLPPHNPSKQNLNSGKNNKKEGKKEKINNKQQLKKDEKGTWKASKTQNKGNGQSWKHNQNGKHPFKLGKKNSPPNFSKARIGDRFKNDEVILKVNAKTKTQATFNGNGNGNGNAYAFAHAHGAASVRKAHRGLITVGKGKKQR